MNFDQLIEEVKKPLKEMGYKKRNLTWVKNNDDEINIIINIRRSQYDIGNYYLNLGVYIRSLGTSEFPKIKLSDCQMQERINNTPTRPNYISE